MIMKSQGLPLAAFLLLIHLIAFPAHARIFPTGIDNKQISSGHHERTLKMILGGNYWRPSRSPPPSPILAPTRHQSSRGASTVDRPDCDNDAADQYQDIDFDNIVVENEKCQRVVLARSPPPPPRPVETQSLIETIIITRSATTDTRRRDDGPTAAAEAEKFGKDYPSPPPPPRGSTPTGHLTPVTLCLPGRPCGGGSLKTTSYNNIN